MVSKQVPGGYFFGVFSKTVILSKSCSRCGGSTIFKGQTLQKSVQRATPNGIGKKKRQKSLPAPSLDALFRSRARFLSILGSRPGPKIVPKPHLEKIIRRLFGSANRFFAFLSLRCVPEGSRTDSGASRDRRGPDFERFWDNYLLVPCGFLSGFVGFRRGVAGIRIQPQKPTRRGSPGVRRSREAV